jgi:hypothetical protein
MIDRQLNVYCDQVDLRDRLQLQIDRYLMAVCPIPFAPIASVVAEPATARIARNPSGNLSDGGVLSSSGSGSSGEAMIAAKLERDVELEGSA